MPSHAGALVYIAKSLVVVVVSSKLAVVQPEVLLLLECLLYRAWHYIIKMSVVIIKLSRRGSKISHVLILQPHYSKNPRPAPECPVCV